MILHDIKESKDAGSSKWKEEDVGAAASILRDYMDMPVSISGCFWICMKCDDPNKPCLLKITVNSFGEKVAVLRNKLRLGKLYSQVGFHNTRPNTYRSEKEQTA